MKILDNKAITFKGKPVIAGEDNSPLDTFALIQSVLENSAYQNSSEIIKASLILGKLKIEDGKLSIEDADYEFIKRFANVYQPLVSKGLLFAEFYQQLN